MRAIEIGGFADGERRIGFDLGPEIGMAAFLPEGLAIAPARACFSEATFSIARVVGMLDAPRGRRHLSILHWIPMSPGPDGSLIPCARPIPITRLCEGEPQPRPPVDWAQCERWLFAREAFLCRAELQGATFAAAGARAERALWL